MMAGFEPGSSDVRSKFFHNHNPNDTVFIIAFLGSFSYLIAKN